MPDGIGIYLGTRSLDLVHTSGTFRAPRLVTAVHTDLNQPLTDAPEAIAALAEPLQRLLRQAHLAASEVHLGIPADTAIVRYFQMPTVPPQDRDSAARFEAKKYHPFKLQDLNADAHIVILKTDPAVMRVMFYAVKKELVTRYLATFQQAGLRPHSLETSLTSLMRVLRRTQQLPPHQAAVLVAMDREVANIAIVQQDLVYLARNVTTVPSAPEASAGPTPAGVTGLHEALVNDTVVSVDYYRRRFPNEPPVTKIVVSSETAPASWLQELSAALELPVEPLEAGRGIGSDHPLAGNTAVAFGLALRALEPRRRTVNLLPRDLQPVARGLLRTAVIETVVAVVLLVTGYSLSAQPVRQLTAQLAALERSVTTNAARVSLQPDELTPETLQQRYAALAAELALVRGAAADVSSASLFSTLTNRTPEMIWLRRLSYRCAATGRGAREVTLEGSAYDPNTATALETINTYAAALNRERTFRQLFGGFTLTAIQRSVASQTPDVTDFRMVSNTLQSSGNP